VTDEEQVTATVHALSMFIDEMRAQHIHVGVGMSRPVRCVTCDQLWPCDGSTNTAVTHGDADTGPPNSPLNPE